MTRREAPSSRDSRSATGVPGAAPHSSPSTHLGTLGRVFRASMLGAATLVAMGAGSACLDRPVAPAEPRTSNTFSERVSLTQIDKIDLLFMVDNSASMADKQKILADAIPDLVGRLVSPDCVQIDATGNVTGRQKNTGTCADGFVVEFNAIKDIHIGVVTSSLGGHGADSCNPATDDADDNDRGRLITRGSAKDSVVPTWAGDSGFFQWDPGAKQTPPGDASADQLNTKFTDLVRGAGQTGCGFEASLEAWYRFLIDPNPPETISIFDSKGTTLVPANVTGIDTALLQQRAEFLRPDSLVAVISLSDENDCSTIEGVLPAAVKRFDGTSESDAEGWNLQDNKSFQINYVPNVRAAGNQAFRMKSGTSACAANPSDPACTECFNNPNGDGCKTLSPNEDSVQVRCWDQKRRFGVDTLYPVQRYVDGLREAEVFDLRSVYTQDDVGRTPGAARLVANPLFQDLAYDLYQTLKGQLTRGEIDQATFDAKTARLGSDISTRGRYASRSADAVFFAAIVGVPWQDIANDPKDLKKGYKLATEVDWDVIRPNNGQKAKDPLMEEAVKPRSGVHPITGETISATGGNSINGHEWNSQEQDLMFACRLPLLPPRDCKGSSTNCDCSWGDADEDPVGTQAAADLAASPLCQEADGKPYGQTQYWAKAYPGTRFVEVMNRFQSGSIIASICTPNVGDPSADDYGYRPAVNAIIDRLKSQLTGKCTPRKLAKVVDEAGNESTPCLIVDAQFAPAKDPTGAVIQPDQTSVSACKVCADRPGREVLSKEIEGLLRRNDDVSQFQCLCGVTQFKGADLAACASGSESVGQTGEKQGWCYIDNSAAGDNDQNLLTKNCPSHTTIRLATDTNKSTFFITCLGAGLTTDAAPTAGAAGASQLAARRRARPSVSPCGAERRVFSFGGHAVLLCVLPRRGRPRERGCLGEPRAGGGRARFALAPQLGTRDGGPVMTRTTRRSRRLAVRVVPAALACSAMLAAPPAEAIRPFVTDDARVVGNKLAQLETWVLVDRVVLEHNALVAIGPTDWLELTAGVVQGSALAAGRRGYSLTGPILQTKALVLPARDNGLPGVALSAGALAPFGRGRFVAPGWTAFGYAALTESLFGEGLLIHANVGLSVGSNGGVSSETGFAPTERAKPSVLVTAGVGFQARVVGGLHAVAEVYHGDPYDPRAAYFASQGGFRYIFSDKVQMDGTVGTTLETVANEEGHVQTEQWGTLGLRIVSPDLWLIRTHPDGALISTQVSSAR